MSSHSTKLPIVKEGDTVIVLPVVVPSSRPAPADNAFVAEPSIFDRLCAAAITGDIPELLKIRASTSDDSFRQAVNWRDKQGFTAVHLAVGAQSDRQALLKKDDSAKAIPEYYSALLQSAESCLPGENSLRDTLKILLENGASINSRAKDGVTALHIAVQKNNVHALAFLLANGAYVDDALEQDGLTALHLAVANNYMDIVRVLLINGASVNKKYRNGVTALRLAVENDQVNIVRILLETNNIKVDILAHDGYTPLHFAAENGRFTAANLLLAKGATVNIRNNEKITPLCSAIYCGHTDMVDLLIGHQANTENVDGKGFSALHIAVTQNQLDIVKLLLARGAGIDSENNGSTPLRLAAYFGHFEIVKILLDKGAARNAMDENGFTALNLAARKGHSAIVELLEQSTKINPENNSPSVSSEGSSVAASRYAHFSATILQDNQLKKEEPRRSPSPTNG